MRTTFVLPFILLNFLSACSNTPQKNGSIKTDNQIDTTKSFKIGSAWITPKQSFKFNTLINASRDTLKLVTCADYVYSPFGLLTNKSQLKSSLLKNFSVTSRVDTLNNELFEFQILEHNSSRLILFFDNDSEASTESYIFKGDISDKDVVFTGGVKIGMSKQSFIQTFFDQFPDELLLKYNTIVFESCVTSIRHIYTFNANKLQSVNFTSDSYWHVNY